jgi:cytoskeletal protein RodZ
MSKKNLKPSNINIDDALSFGRYLKTARSDKGLSLNEIAAEMRVPEKTLAHLEDETHEKLPDEVFVRGFVRAYSEIVDTNADEAVQRYLASRHQYLQSLQFERHFLKAGQTFWPRLLLILGTLVGIMLLSILALHKFNGSTATNEDTASAIQAKAPGKTSADRLKQPQTILTDTQKPQSYLLRIKTIEATWLKVIIDRQQPKEYSLSPGDRLELRATSEFNLLVGNAAGINLQLNDRPIRIEGRHGQVVSLKLPQ